MKYKDIINILEQGKLAIIPTDTTYGIICDATNIEAIKKVFYAKKRDFNNPLIILVSDYDMLKKYTKDINLLEDKIIQKYMPGPLSILLKKNDLISNLITAHSPFVAIRIPNNKPLQKLITEFNKPIVATSANISGNDIITKIDDIPLELLNNIDYIYNAGPIKNKPSTLIKVDDNKIIFLRKGLLTYQLEQDQDLKIN